jgi:integrase
LPHEPGEGGAVAGSDPPDELGIVELRRMALGLTGAAEPQWRPFLIVALKTGLRVGELLALKWQDLDLVAGHIIVRRTLWQDQEGPPKGGRTGRCRSPPTRSRR